ncbi:hypothetical protein [Rhodoplanes sp. Z2-YC6860]|uniref:hypothetical protein n=1 Tax=Rhodoplanes sp. Z2-YC6860 TaxID=674703 RepID=UPI00078B8AE8|nr:hypothetical protein [Rhodoplanes sp. Z2-YC6860]AMN39356.1 hypothetical protein RHPLAN_08940 [Rhodoplanes sp. Z2-YC6860]
MMKRFGIWLAAIAIAALLVPDAAIAAKSHRQTVQRSRIVVHPKPRRWHGYGFLPGYRPQLAESQGTPVFGPPIPRREPRYINLYNGNVQYGWGRPGYFRGQWNGGGFGPCWTYTPIGMMPNCN